MILIRAFKLFFRKLIIKISSKIECSFSSLRVSNLGYVLIAFVTSFGVFSFAALSNVYAHVSGSPNVTQIHYSVRDDDGSETAASFLNTDVSAIDTDSSNGVSVGSTFRVRFQLSNEGTAANSTDTFTIQYAALSGAGSCTSVSGGSYSNVPVTPTTEPVEMVTTANYTDQTDASNCTATTSCNLTDENSSFDAGDLVADPSNTTTVKRDLDSAEFAEMEFAMAFTSNATHNETYCFRLTPVDTYSVVPGVIADNPPTVAYEQSAYRFFEGNNGTSVSTALAAQDNAATLTSSGQEFRLRLLLHVSSAQLDLNGENFKLQFAQQSGTCDTSFIGETYADVTSSSTIAYKNNTTPADGDNLTVNASLDPAHSGHTTDPQDYEEANNFTNSVSSIAVGEDGMWDFSLIDNGAPSSTAYCFRVLLSDNSQLDTYTVIPQITTGTPSSSTFEQSGYRWLENNDGTSVSTALASQDSSYTLTSTGQEFRLRMLLHIGTAQLDASGENFKLQFATRSGTCDTSFTGETYVDVTGVTAISYTNNPSPNDGDSLTANGSLDPVHSGHTTVEQTYEESNNFTNSVAAIPSGQDGLWDFALVDNGAPSSTAYCFRAVLSDGSQIDTYTVVPEITTSAPSLSTYELSGFRFFENTNGTSVSTALAGQNSSATLTSNGEEFRLRVLIHVGTAQVDASGENFKLQYAERSGTCDTSFVGETYEDVTTLTPIAYKDNSSPSDGDSLTANATLDPTHSGHNVVEQTYEESNNFTNSVAAIPAGEDGMWDLSLVDYSGGSNAVYCLRVILGSGSNLDTYTFIPEVTLASAYSTMGTYTSGNYDTGGISSFNVIEWDFSLTDVGCGTCDVRVQIQTAPDAGGLPGTWSSTWCGPEGEDGDETDYYTVETGELIHTDHNGDQWIRYLVTFDGDGTDTPILEEIRLNYQ